MTVVHVVTLSLQSDELDTVITNLSAALDDLAGEVDAKSYHHGRDLHIRDGNADYAITAIFSDEQTFRAYMESPKHQRIIRELVTPHLKARSAVQFAAVELE